MKNAWFVLLLFASILIQAAIVDSARLRPVAAGTFAPCPPPAIEARGDVTPATTDASRLQAGSSDAVPGPAPVSAPGDATSHLVLQR